MIILRRGLSWEAVCYIENRLRTPATDAVFDPVIECEGRSVLVNAAHVNWTIPPVHVGRKSRPVELADVHAPRMALWECSVAFGHAHAVAGDQSTRGASRSRGANLYGRRERSITSASGAKASGFGRGGVGLPLTAVLSPAPDWTGHFLTTSLTAPRSARRSASARDRAPGKRGAPFRRMPRRRRSGRPTRSRGWRRGTLPAREAYSPVPASASSAAP